MDKMTVTVKVTDGWKDICIYCKQDGEPCNNCAEASKFEGVDDE